MKEAKIYICDVCAARYDNQKDCEICENSHSAVGDIHILYKPGEKYPYAVVIDFENGNKESYFAEDGKMSVFDI